MKLQSLHINHFGHFSDFDLQLGSAPFVVLHGHNEAGKTTLLQFLRQLLFGFEARTPYNFGAGEVGGTSNLVLKDGRLVELRRRKGNKNTVSLKIDGLDSPLDDAGFKQLLGHANENVFRSVFAFGLGELRDGHKALQEESLQSALFGGGFGGAFNPEKLLNDFDSQAEKLFKARGSSPSINVICAGLKDIAKVIKEKTVRPDDYEQRRQDWQAAHSKSETLAAEVTELRVRHARTEKLVKALPLWVERRAHRAERSALTVPERFPAEARSEFVTLVETLERLRLERELLQQALTDAERDLSDVSLDQTLLPLKAEIIECHGQVKSVEDARHDLPLRRAERDQAEQAVVAKLKELRPGWSLSDLREFSVDVATRSRMDGLIESRKQLDAERTKLETKREEAHAALAQLASDLGELDAPEDVSALAAVVEQAAEFASEQKTLTKSETERAKQIATLTARRARLSPPLPLSETSDFKSGISNLRSEISLPVPSQKQIAQFDAQYRDVEQRLTTARLSLTEEEAGLARLERNLQQLEQQQLAVPKLEELQAGRARRDAGWQLFRDTHLAGRELGAEISQWLAAVGGVAGAAGTLADRYEQAVVRADELADAIFKNADEVSRREQLKQQIESARHDVARKQAACDSLRQEQHAVTQRWVELWQPCGCEPLSPEAMQSWRSDFALFAETHEQLRHLEVDLAALRGKLDEFTTTFRRAMNAADGDVTSWLVAAKKRVKTATEQDQQRKQWERDRTRIAKQLDGTIAALRDWDARQTDWIAGWQAVLSQLGLPSDWETELARRVIVDLAATQAKLANLNELSSRIEAMAHRINDFDPRVRRLAEQLSVVVDAERPEITARLLQMRLAEASQAQERRDHLEKSLKETRRKLVSKDAELSTKQTRRSELLAAAGASSDAEFVSIADTVRQASDFDARIGEIGRGLELLRGNEAASEFEAHLTDADQNLMEATLGDLHADLVRREVESKAAFEAAITAKKAFEELDGSDAAALGQEQLARKQAQLASEVQRFVPLVFAKRLLQDAIKRFERENQPELIGSISTLFRTMTRGKYVEIERPASDREALSVRRADGAERRPDQLSTGTREQLYLAIRLAYVLHYCRQTEPLPIIMDDVLVNFDADRSRATLEALREVSREVQVVFFTCHSFFVDLIGEVFPEVVPVRLQN